MNLIYINCHLCGSNDYSEIYHQKAKWLNIKYTNVICKKCGFVFRNPTMDWKDYMQLYKKGNNLLSSSMYINYEEDSRSSKQRRERLKFLFDSISFDRGNVLDVGGGDGFLLDGFDNNLWNKVMVEPGDLGNIAKRKGIKVFKIGIEEFDYLKNFDIIMCTSVMEHLLNPKVIVKKAFKLLNNRSYLFLEVPDSLKPFIKISEFYSFEHICGFTLDSLQYLLNSEGFKIINIDNNCSFSSLRVIAKKDNQLKGTSTKSDFSKMINVVNRYKLERSKFLNLIKEKLKIFFDKTYHNKIAVYGAGNHTIQLLEISNFLDNISCFLDSATNKQGTRFLGKPVLSPDRLEFLDIKVAILSSGDYQDEMYKRIKKFEERGKVKIVKLYPEGTI